MSDVLTQLREDIAAMLAAGGIEDVFPNWPARAVPYSAVVTAGLPYITQGSPGEVPFGHVVVNHRVVLIAGGGDPDTQCEEIGSLVLRCLRALGDQWDEVSDFYFTNPAGLGDVVACDISVPKVINLEDPNGP